MCKCSIPQINLHLSIYKTNGCQAKWSDAHNFHNYCCAIYRWIKKSTSIFRSTAFIKFFLKFSFRFESENFRSVQKLWVHPSRGSSQTSSLCPNFLKSLYNLRHKGFIDFFEKIKISEREKKSKKYRYNDNFLICKTRQRWDLNQHYP